MLLKKNYYFTLIFLIAGSPVSFSQPCGSAFSLSRKEAEFKPSETSSRYEAIEIDSYRGFLIRAAQSSLGVKSLNPQQIKALETYHHIVQGEAGKDGTLSRAGNYTSSQIRRIMKFLRKHFFSKQLTTLIEDGIVEIYRMDPKEIVSRRQIQYFRRREPVFIIVEGIDKKIHQGRAKLLEETDNFILSEVEKIDTESGRLIKEEWFFYTGASNYRRFNTISEFGGLKIIEKTENGFLIGTHKSENVAFFSFKKAMENNLLPRNPTLQDYHQLESILNSYSSGRWDQIPALREAVEEGVLDKNHSAYRDFIASLDKSVVEEADYYIKDVKMTLNPEMEIVYSAVQSAKRKISISELVLLPPKDIESQFIEWGYKPGYIARINLVNTWISLRRELIRLQVNPYVTHIEYFAVQIPFHIAYIRKGLEENYSPKDESYGSKLEQLKKLKDLEGEAEKAVLKEKVTYKWWLEFNMKLAEVMSGKHESELTGYVQRLKREALIYFPLKMVIPITKGDIGIITFRKSGIEGVYPAGLINQQSAKVHGSELSSFLYLIHDFFHSSVKGNQIYREYSVGHRLFHRRLMHNIENLPPEKRKTAEAIYSTLTRENEDSSSMSYSNWAPENIRYEVAKHIGFNSAGFFKFSDDPIQIKEKVESLTDLFMEVYIQTLQHQ